MFFLLLVIPISASFQNDDKLANRTNRTLADINPTIEVVTPDIPLHISGKYFADYERRNMALFLTDEHIYVVQRSYDYYYKWIFSCESAVQNKSVIMSNIEVDESKSVFLFSERYNIENCEVDYGKEYSYKDVKEKCSGNLGIIDDVISKIRSADSMKILCKEIKAMEVVGYAYCELKVNNTFLSDSMEQIRIIYLHYIKLNRKFR